RRPHPRAPSRAGARAARRRAARLHAPQCEHGLPDRRHPRGREGVRHQRNRHAPLHVDFESRLPGRAGHCPLLRLRRRHRHHPGWHGVGASRPATASGAMSASATRSSATRARISPTLIAGALLTLLIVGAAALAPAVAPYAPTAQDLSAGLQPPSLAHLFGTDQLGRDIFSRVLFAARTDLRIALLSAITPFVVGGAIGLLTGYFGGHLRGAVGWISARVTDTFIAFPF